MYAAMTATHHPVGAEPPKSPDAGETRRDRIAQESRLLDEARSAVRQGHTVSEAQIDAWVESLGGKDELTPPRSDL